MGGKCLNCRSYNTTQTGGVTKRVPEHVVSDDSAGIDDEGAGEDEQVEMVQ